MKTRPARWPDIVKGAAKTYSVDWEPETKGRTIDTVTWSVPGGANGLVFSESAISSEITQVLVTAGNPGDFVINCKITMSGISESPIAVFRLRVTDNEDAT